MLSGGQSAGSSAPESRDPIQGIHAIAAGMVGPAANPDLNGLNAAIQQLFAMDAQWVTAKPNGPDNKGTPLLIGRGGKVIGGAGGKLNGQKNGKGGKSKGGSGSGAGGKAEKSGFSASLDQLNALAKVISAGAKEIEEGKKELDKAAGV
jgi:hypothetical protein